MGYRDDDFWREQDRGYQNFRDDLEWDRKVRDRNSSLAREAMRRGDTAWALHHVGGTDYAIDLLQSDSSSVPDYRDLAREQVKRGVARLRDRDYADARDLFTDALAYDPDYADALLYRADCYRRLGLPSLAINDFDAADLKGADRAVVCNGKGLAYLEERDYDKAIVQFGLAITHAPDFAPAWFNRASCYLDQDRPADALDDLDKTLELTGERGQTLLVRAAALYRLGRMEESKQALERARALEPNDPRVPHRLGLILVRESREAEAEAQFDAAIALDDRYCSPRIDRARLRMGRGDYEGVIEDTSRWLELRPDTALALRLRGSALESLRRWDEAVADLDRAIQLDDSDGFAWLYRSRCRRETGDLEGALADADAAVLHAVDWHLPYFERALVKRKLGDVEGALANLDATVSLKPDFAAAFAERGVLRLKSGMPEKALEDFDRAVELRPDVAWFHYDRGQARMNMKHNLLAAAAFKEAARLFEQNGRADEQARALARMEEMLR